MDMAIAPVTRPPADPQPAPAAPAAGTATASGGVQRARAQRTLLRDAVHESSVVLLNQLQTHQQVETGAQNFQKLLDRAMDALQEKVQAEYLAASQYQQVEALQAQQASQWLQKRISPVDPDLLRAQTDLLARTL